MTGSACLDGRRVSGAFAARAIAASASDRELLATTTPRNRVYRSPGLGMGDVTDVLPTLPSLDDMGLTAILISSKAALNARVESLDAQIAACDTLTDATKRGWSAWRKNWAAFYAKDVSMLTVAFDAITIRSLRANLDEWERAVSEECKVQAPHAANPTPAESAATFAKWALVAALVVGGGYFALRALGTTANIAGSAAKIRTGT